MMKINKILMNGLVLIVVAGGLVAIGLIPAVLILLTDIAREADAFVMAGIAWGVACTTAVCEFILGAVAVLVWNKWRTREKTEPRGPC